MTHFHIFLLNDKSAFQSEVFGLHVFQKVFQGSVCLSTEQFSILPRSILYEPWSTDNSNVSGSCSLMASFLHDRAAFLDGTSVIMPVFNAVPLEDHRHLICFFRLVLKSSQFHVEKNDSEIAAQSGDTLFLFFGYCIVINL